MSQPLMRQKTVDYALRLSLVQYYILCNQLVTHILLVLLTLSLADRIYQVVLKKYKLDNCHVKWN